MAPPISAGLAVATVATNVALITWPLVNFPYSRAKTELRAALGDGSLAVTFAAFPGRVYLGSFDLQGVLEDKLDVALTVAGSIPAFEAQQRQIIDRALTAGRHVYVFGVLDFTNWNAPWSLLAAKGHDEGAALYVPRKRTGGSCRMRRSVASPPGSCCRAVRDWRDVATMRYLDAWNANAWEAFS